MYVLESRDQNQKKKIDFEAKFGSPCFNVIFTCIDSPTLCLQRANVMSNIMLTERKCNVNK